MEHETSSPIGGMQGVNAIGVIPRLRTLSQSDGSGSAPTPSPQRNLFLTSLTPHTYTLFSYRSSPFFNLFQTRSHKCLNLANVVLPPQGLSKGNLLTPSKTSNPPCIKQIPISPHSHTKTNPAVVLPTPHATKNPKPFLKNLPPRAPLNHLKTIQSWLRLSWGVGREWMQR